MNEGSGSNGSGDGNHLQNSASCGCLPASAQNSSQFISSTSQFWLFFPLFCGWTLPQAHICSCALAAGDHGIMRSFQGSTL
eukprot:CAMPEP_0172698606 /NCGR_PEP_ID=MMETSP1074-20121228/29599_1 /TAXON_ID=2916 /ORGANISM="Ceratium fusus, Strain PA161109" /LENGTH=80 /DNA_ID=CAMNT_0013519679 /DNA_START=254 /DNA_END=496 /DNA_ORIENTATION=+